MDIRTKIYNLHKTQQGFAALYLAVILFGVILAISLSISVLALSQQRIAQNAAHSAKAYFAAEAGAEDALLRLSDAMSWSSPYTVQVGDATADVTISDISGGARTITSKGNADGRIRTVEVVYEISGDTPGFYYGAQVGDLGIEMENLARIIGNVFSNGELEIDNNAVITGTVQVASVGNQIIGGDIQGDAYVDMCNGADITGVLHAQSETGCTYSAFVVETPPDPIPMPLSAATITEWKNDAAAGGVFIGNYTRDSGITSLGPKKIEGNLTIENDAQLVVTGTLWVTGNIIVKNNAQVRLHSGYGTGSGTIIADGVISLENNTISSGSGQAGSYLMYLSTSSLNPALIIKNNAIADILYTSNGFVEVQNGTAMREITGYGIRVKNNATVTYEIGLESAVFTSGPGGGWSVTSWKEIE